MSPRRVVVDGSNIATEGRSIPSLAQLDEAVRAFREEFPTDEITVVVDATFAHRIDESERAEFEEAAAHGELVYPPAGAVGRGDAFLLRIAEKTDAIVLSNDSFQEFHGEHDWLFTKDRLIGGMPVPGVGWVFVPRTPVRGPKSRESVKEAKKTRARVGSKEAAQPMPVPKAPPPGPGRKKAGAAAKAPDKQKLQRAIAEATQEAVAPDDDTADGGRGRRRRRKRKSGGTGAAPLPTLNEPLTFITFIAEHKLGDEVEAEVESFASHGAFALVGDARCYVPLSAMGNPPPRSAREVLTKGEKRTFVLQALDAPRRGIELALPGFEKISGHPTEETVEAEIGEAETPAVAAPEPSRRTARAARALKTTAKAAKATRAAKKAASTGVTKTAKATKATAGTTKPTKATKTTKATKASKAATKRTAAKRSPTPAADPVAADAVSIVPEAVPELPLAASTVIAARRGPALEEAAPVTVPAEKVSAARKAKATVAKKSASSRKKAVAAPAETSSKKAVAKKAAATKAVATKKKSATAKEAAAATKKTKTTAATTATAKKSATTTKKLAIAKKATTTKKTATKKKAAARKST